MEKLLPSGKARAIGVSNFSKKELETLLKECSVVPAAHQIECHPWLQQKDFCDWQREKGIHVQHYSPFGNQNEIYSSGKNMGKLMVCFLSSFPLPSLLNSSHLIFPHTISTHHIKLR